MYFNNLITEPDIYREIDFQFFGLKVPEKLKKKIDLEIFWENKKLNHFYLRILFSN